MYDRINNIKYHSQLGLSQTEVKTGGSYKKRIRPKKLKRIFEILVKQI